MTDSPMTRAERVRSAFLEKRMTRTEAMQAMRTAVDPLNITDAGLAQMLDDRLPLDRERLETRSAR